MGDQEARRKSEPHWLIVLSVGIVVALFLTWLGFNDWRFPWVSNPESDPGVNRLNRGHVAYAKRVGPYVVDTSRTDSHS